MGSLAVLSWFDSYLFNRSQSVSVKGEPSRSVLLPFGVPQIYVLEPILYTLYSNPLREIAVACGVSDLYYLDDEQQRLAFSALENCVWDTKQWASINRLKINDDNTDAMVVSAKIIRKKNTD